MSSLWTPGGEHDVPRDHPPTNPAPAASADPDLDDAIAAVLPEGMRLDDLSPEQRAQAEEMVREMTAARERLLEAPAAAVVANHAMGLYELGALHLSQQHPNFGEVTVAIDALAALVDGLGSRLGEAEQMLTEGLDQLRMAFVQLRNQAASHDEDSAEG